MAKLVKKAQSKKDLLSELIHKQEQELQLESRVQRLILKMLDEEVFIRSCSFVQEEVER